MKAFIGSTLEFLWNVFITRLPSSMLRYLVARMLFKNIGRGVFLAIGVEVRAPWNITIGARSVINKGVLLDGRGGLSIGHDSDVARDSFIWTMSHDPHKVGNPVYSCEKSIGNYCWIGARSQILVGANISDFAVIGAGSIVTHNVAEGVIAAGNPARQLGLRRQKDVYKLKFSPFLQ